jgi:hypothetical protein
MWPPVSSVSMETQPTFGVGSSRSPIAGWSTSVGPVTEDDLAFAGSLPAGAQGVASEVLSKIGVTVPGANSHANSHSSNASTEAPPEAAWFGLCTAWQSGQGGEQGKKDQATAFEQLSAAAGTTTVQGFCADVVAEHNASLPSGVGEPTAGTSTASTESGGRSDSGLGHKP